MRLRLTISSTGTIASIRANQCVRYRFNYQILPSTPTDDCRAAQLPEPTAMSDIVLSLGGAATRTAARRPRSPSPNWPKRTFAQIERLNPQLNAFADFDAERVRAQARALDASTTMPRGPLHGLAGHCEVFDRHRGLSMRNRQPAAQGRGSARRCGRRRRACARPEH